MGQPTICERLPVAVGERRVHAAARHPTAWRASSASRGPTPDRTSTGDPSRAAPARRRSSSRCRDGRRRGTRPVGAGPSALQPRWRSTVARRPASAAASMSGSTSPSSASKSHHGKHAGSGTGYAVRDRRHVDRMEPPNCIAPTSTQSTGRSAVDEEPPATHRKAVEPTGCAVERICRGDPAACQATYQLVAERRVGGGVPDPQHDVGRSCTARSSRAGAPPVSRAPMHRLPQPPHDRLHPVRPSDDRRTGGSRGCDQATLSTSTPGLSRPSGSNSCLSRRCSSTTGAVGSARRLRVLVVDDADADLGDERARCRSGRRARTARPTSGHPSAAPADRRPGSRPAGGGLRRRRRARRPRAAPTSSRRPTAPTSAGTARRRPRTGRAVLTNHCSQRGPRTGAQDHVAEEAERAVRADEQAAQVEAADVLDRRPAGLDDLAGGRRRSAPAAGRRGPGRRRGGACRCARRRAHRRPCRRAAAPPAGRARRAPRRARRRACRRRSGPSSRRAGSSRCPPARITRAHAVDRTAARCRARRS